MAVSVLVVDDSAFFRLALKAMIGADNRLKVIGTAENGAQAVEMVERLRPDVVTMDIEMPVMDGITAVKKIMATCPTPVLMLSSYTTEGAKATLDALDAGAVDFLPKDVHGVAGEREMVQRQLCARIRIIGARGLRQPARSVARAAAARPAVSLKCDLQKYDVIAIGTSTGGPAALQQILTVLPQGFPVPIVLVQHMPASFTPPFAERLDGLCRIRVKHAQTGDCLEAGTALLAPGGCQMILERRDGALRAQVQRGAADQTYKPSVDITFSSAAQAVGARVLAIVLTGMGSDGREGTRLLKRAGATVWAQDEATSIVYGMPLAVVEAGLADAVLSPAEIGTVLAHGV